MDEELEAAPLSELAKLYAAGWEEDGVTSREEAVQVGSGLVQVVHVNVQG